VSVPAALGDLGRWVYWHPFRRLVMITPPGLVYPFGRLGAGLLGSLARGRRRSLEEVLPLVCAGGDRRRREQIVRAAFVMLCQTELEVLLYPALNPARIAGLVACQGLEILDEALGRGRGAMLMFAHFGANQMIMPALGYRGYTMCQLSAPPTVWAELLPGKKFSALGKEALEIRWRHEQSLPVRHINVFGSLKEAFRCLGRNEILGVAVDGGGGKTRVAVDFLGRQALFSTGAMELAQRTQCAVLPAFILRARTGRHTLVIEPPLAIDRPADPDAVRRHLARFVQRLEHYVLRYPDHYLSFLALRNEMAKRGDTPFFLP
jgi:phosphatidylinositol dimannoside acyltransferase